MSTELAIVEPDSFAVPMRGRPRHPWPALFPSRDGRTGPGGPLRSRNPRGRSTTNGLLDGCQNWPMPWSGPGAHSQTFSIIVIGGHALAGLLGPGPVAGEGAPSRRTRRSK
jgi:hypothetical protein